MDADELRPMLETQSGLPIEELYGPEDFRPEDYEAKLGDPGQYPFTRGIYKNMYRGRLWTMRQYAGMGTARQTNERFRYLLDQGQTGLSVAFDLPTQLGYDSDSPEAQGEVGRVGVAIDSLRDMELIFEGIPLDKVSASFTINATAPIILAMYQAVGDLQGVSARELRGTIQNDILKEFGARGAWVLPVDPSMKLVVDCIEYCTRQMPRFHPISIASHYRDAGANPVEEMAYTLSSGKAYVRAALDRGLEVDEFAPHLSWFFYTYTNFFEEVAKYRAGRRLWARIMREEFGARDPRSWMMRAACVCGGHSLTKQEPLNNIARLTIEMMAVACAGLQSVFTAAYDEAFALPTAESAKTSLRIQQIVAYETDIPSTADPLGGSFFVESLTDAMEEAIGEVMDDIESRGGMVECLKSGYVQQRIAERASEHERAVASGQKIIVGVNRFATGELPADMELYEVDHKLEQEQVERLKEVKAGRDSSAVARSLGALEEAARTGANTLPPLLDCVKAYATVGEMMGVFRKVFGEYVPLRTF
jgi:methylmalonyl-CoA mutase N-terminal domain/subunit